MARRCIISKRLRPWARSPTAVSAYRRSAVRQRHDLVERPQDPRCLCLPGEVAGGVEISVGLLQAGLYVAGQAGLPDARAKWLQSRPLSEHSKGHLHEPT